MRYAPVFWLVVGGCDDVLWGEGEDGVDDVPVQSGYDGVVELTRVNCYGCHSEAASGSAGFGLNLETDLHVSTVGVAGAYGVPLVAPGAPGDSMLYLKMTGDNPDNTGVIMPPGGGLSVGATDVVRAWIEDGAPSE